MMHRLKRAPLLFLILLLALPSACIFSPEKKPPTQVAPPSYPVPNTPFQALSNMITAYVARDSVETEKIYDVNYEGISNYPGAPSGGAQFTRYDEARHVGALKLNVNIVSVSLDLGNPNTWRRIPADPLDPPGCTVIPIPASTVRIDDVGRNTLYESVNRIIQYTFIPTVTGPGDSTWAIYRWREDAN